MIITWQQNGRFGNNMFQYCLAHVIADDYDLEVKTCPNFSEEETHYSGFYDEFFYLDEKHKENIANFKYLSDDDIVDFLKNNKSIKNNIRLEGYFQNTELFTGKDVTKYFNITDGKMIHTDDNDICLNLRIGVDYQSINWVISPHIFKALLDKIEFNRLHIISDTPNYEYLDNFKEYNPIIYNNFSSNPIDDFYKLMSFKNIIIPNSTFSYWAAVLGKSTKIYAPEVWSFNDLNYILTKKDQTTFYNI